MLRVLEKPEVDLDDVVDVNEVAALLAIAITAAAFEQTDFARGLKLAAEMVDDARHRFLVRLLRTVDIEVAQADDLCTAVG